MATPHRTKLPNRRRSFTHRAKVGGQTVFLTFGEYDDGSLGEVFIDVSKTGTAVRALLNALAVAVSRGLQYGVPPREFIAAFREFHFDPCGPVEGDAYIKEAESILDYVFHCIENYYVHKLPPISATNVDYSEMAS